MSALTQKASGRAALLIAAIASVMLLLASILTGTASAADPQLVRNVDDDACIDLGFDVDDVDVEIPRGSDNDDPPEFNATIELDGGATLTVFSPANRSRVDFSVEGALVEGAVLFNRTNQKLGNLYDYGPEGGVSEGTLLPPPRDNGNDKRATFCFVEKADPTISTSATAQAVVGQAISDTATLTGGDAPTGTVTFTLYSDASCQTEVTQLTGTVQADGTASSGDYTTTAAGTYYWIASYGGDDANNPASGSCGDPGETSVVSKATPTLTTTATASATVGDPISDSANLSAGFNPTGKITFSLYSDDTCSTLVTTLGPATVNGNGDYGSGDYTTTAAGTFYWIASYDGDSNNNGVTGTCGTSSEISVVAKATPSLSTVATQNAVIGDAISDTATLTGGFGLGGSITFTLYDDASCANLVTTLGPFDVSGDGDYESGDYDVPATLDAAGTYYWIASYSGDANNDGATGLCGDEGEVTTVYEFNAKCGVPITRIDPSNPDNSATFIRPNTVDSPGCNNLGTPTDDTDKFGSINFFVNDGTPGVELALSGDGEPNAKFVGEISFDTEGLDAIPVIKIDDDEDESDDFRVMEWNIDDPGPTLFFDSQGNLINADFTCPVNEIWCILDALVQRETTTWRLGGIGVDPKWSI